MSSPELRIGDAEREVAVGALGDHYAAGRLTKEEYDERSAAAYEARTRAALEPLFADLPRPQAARPEPPAERTGVGGPGPRWRFALVPVLLLALLVSVLVGHPVVLLVLVGYLVLRFARLRRPYRDYRNAQGSWGHHRHHPHGRP